MIDNTTVTPVSRRHQIMQSLKTGGLSQQTLVNIIL